MDGINNRTSLFSNLAIIFIGLLVVILVIIAVLFSLQKKETVSPLPDEKGKVRVIFVSPEPTATISATPTASASASPKTSPKASPKTSSSPTASSSANTR